MSGPTSRMVSLAWIEYFAACGIFSWGFWTYSWGPDEALSAAAFDGLRASVTSWGLGPAWVVLGLAGMILGAAYACAVKVNGHGMYWTPLVRGASCISAVVFLAHLAISIVGNQPSSTGVFTYSFIAIVYFAIFLANLDRIATSSRLIWRHFRGVDS